MINAIIERSIIDIVYKKHIFFRKNEKPSFPCVIQMSWNKLWKNMVCDNLSRIKNQRNCNIKTMHF